MDESKINDKVAVSQYRKLDGIAKYFASTMLQLMAATFQNPYQIQFVIKIEKQATPDSQGMTK